MVAVERCHSIAADMTNMSIKALTNGLWVLHKYNPALTISIREFEEKTDYYEDILGTYLVKLSAYQINKADSSEAAKLLKIIGDFERISDHCPNIAGCFIEMDHNNMNLHESLKELRNDSSDFKDRYEEYSKKYSLKGG